MSVSNDVALLELRGVSKSFPGVQAVQNVDFILHEGEVAGLVGENGAGKSTLMKVIAGIYPAGSYEGSVLVEGVEHRFRSVREAETQGVVLLPQELHVAPNLSIAENMFVGRLPGQHGTVDEHALHEQARTWLGVFGLDAPPGARASVLSPAEQREVMLAAALSKEARILVLDEPTASLSETESLRLFSHIKRLRDSGVGVIYISHRLDDIERIADSVTVMRNGRMVKRFSGGRFDHGETVRAMIGRDPESLAHNRKSTTIGGPVLSVDRLRVYDPIEQSLLRVADASFTLHAGEVLGLFGLVGAGRSELARALFGDWSGRIEGNVEVAGRPGIPRSPAQAIRRGIAMVTEDRKKSGLFPAQSVNANISAASLGHVSGWLRIARHREFERNDDLVKRLRIKTSSLATQIDFLSGGNQQKAVVARWLAAAPLVMLLDEPTTGVDVGARFELYEIVHEVAAEGRGVVLISSDLEEIITQCDRILVMYRGEIRAEFDGKRERHALMAAATGGSA